MLQGHAIVQKLSLCHLGKILVGFEVNIMALGWVSLQVLRFSPGGIQAMLHSLFHLYGNLIG
jgi:flagellar biosynthesis protein FliQ